MKKLPNYQKPNWQQFTPKSRLISTWGLHLLSYQFVMAFVCCVGVPFPSPFPALISHGSDLTRQTFRLRLSLLGDFCLFQTIRLSIVGLLARSIRGGGLMKG